MLEIDITTDEFVRDPYPLYERLREERVVRILPFDVYGLTRYDDVTAAFRDYEGFSSEAMHTFFQRIRKTKTDPLGRTLVSLDPPRHFAMRRTLSTAFSLIDFDGLRSFTEQTAHRLLDAVLPSGELDIVSDYATPIALRVISWLLGIDPDRAADFRRWTDDATVNAIRSTAGEMPQIEQSHAEMHDYFQQKMDRLRDDPDEKLLSRLIGFESDGKIASDELLDLARFLLFAGNKTTRHFIGNAVLALLKAPAVMADVQKQPERVAGLIDELLRYDTPSQFAIRNLTQDRQYDGVNIERGSVVFLMSGSANRDGSVFPNPDTLDPQRDASGHVGLGTGTHHCLGGKVAKVQSETALRVLFERTAEIRLKEGTLEYHPLLFLRGLKWLPCMASPTGTGWLL